MRIAYVCADAGVPVFGSKGSSVHVQEIIRAFIKRGARIELFAGRLGGEPPPDLKGIHVHKLPNIAKSDPAFLEHRAFLGNSELRALLEGNAPFDIIYERYSLWSYAGMEYANNCGIPGILEVNAPMIEEQEKYRILINRASAVDIAICVYNLATHIIAVSKPIASYIKRRTKRGKRVHILPNGVNPYLFSTKVIPSCSASPGTFTVGFLGTLKPWHGLPNLIKAFSMFHRWNPSSRLLLVGDGPERNGIEAGLLSGGLLDSVHFTGLLPHDKVPGFLASMDVAVAPYSMQRNFYFSPLKLYEYMATGLPVVASNIGQIKEIIQNRKNGILVPPGDSFAFARALERLRNNPKMRKRLGRAARSTVVRHHTWDGIVRRILKLVGFDLGLNDDLSEVGT
jgi:glycosyltransferase involved in cell wall biosynthesis